MSIAELPLYFQYQVERAKFHYIESSINFGGLILCFINFGYFMLFEVS